MTHRPQPKYANKNARSGPWTTCDTCGFIWSYNDMGWQFDFDGTSTPQNQWILRCPRCMSDMQFQRKMIIIPPDPPPYMNVRPEQYRVDETDFLTSEDDRHIITQGGDNIITDIPNPSDDGVPCHLVSSISAIGGSGSALLTSFLELFNGNPLADGVSIQSAVTGSATRVSIGGSLAVTTASAINTSAIIVTTSSLATVNVTHLALYTAATLGTRLMTGPVSASPSLQQRLRVQFDIGALSIRLS